MGPEEVGASVQVHPVGVFRVKPGGRELGEEEGPGLEPEGVGGLVVEPEGEAGPGAVLGRHGGGLKSGDGHGHGQSTVSFFCN